VQQSFKDLQERRIYVAFDCLNVIKEINSEVSKGEHCMIMMEIVAWRLKFQQAVFSHERREANKEAHTLARLATTTLAGMYWYPCKHLDHYLIKLRSFH
jgi:hypothetical protein